MQGGVARRRALEAGGRAGVRMVRARAQSSQEDLKGQSAAKAVEWVRPGMRVGLGTGSTAAFAVDRVGELLNSGELSDILAVPTSVKTQQQAQRSRNRC